tara:strand:- start:1504 stop:2274 length:771 start_codon:yes stop_codon:yes gene_type:complete
MDKIYLILATLVFLAGFVIAVIALRTGKHGTGRLNVGLAVVGLIFQCLFLRERGELHGRCPITNGSEVLVFISWSVVIMYLVLGRAFRLSLLGVFSMPMVFLFQSFAIFNLMTNDPGARPPETLDPWLEMHAAMSLLAYGAFGLAGIAGVMDLVLDRQLKSHEPGQLFYSLPPMKYLYDAMLRLIIIGCGLLTIGIVSAFFMKNLPDALHWVVSGAVWVAYLAILGIHLAKGLRPRLLSKLSIAAFTFALIALSVL